MKDILDLTEKKDFDPSKFESKKPKTVYRQRRVPWDKDGTDIHTNLNRGSRITDVWNPFTLSWNSTSTTNNNIYLNNNMSWTYFTSDLMEVTDDDEFNNYNIRNYISNIIMNDSTFNTTTTFSFTDNINKYNKYLYTSRMPVVDGVGNYHGMRTGKVSQMRKADPKAYYSRAYKYGESNLYIEYLSKNTFKEDNYRLFKIRSMSDEIKRRLKTSLHDCFFDEYYNIGEFRKRSSYYRYDYNEPYFMLTDNSPLDKDTFDNLIINQQYRVQYAERRLNMSNNHNSAFKNKFKMTWFNRHDEYLREIELNRTPRKEWRGITERKNLKGSPKSSNSRLLNEDEIENLWAI